MFNGTETVQKVQVGRKNPRHVVEMLARDKNYTCVIKFKTSAVVHYIDHILLLPHCCTIAPRQLACSLHRFIRCKKLLNLVGPSGACLLSDA